MPVRRDNYLLAFAHEISVRISKLTPDFNCKPASEFRAGKEKQSKMDLRRGPFSFDGSSSQAAKVEANSGNYLLLLSEVPPVLPLLWLEPELVLLVSKLPLEPPWLEPLVLLV